MQNPVDGLVVEHVVEGAGRFLVGTDEATAGPGEVVWAPAGVVHGVRNEGDGRLTLLVGTTRIRKPRIRVLRRVRCSMVAEPTSAVSAPEVRESRLARAVLPTPVMPVTAISG